MLAGGTGIGKSLFSRSIALRLCSTGVRVAYLGYEESTATTYERMLSECMGEAMYRKPEEWRVARANDIRAAAKTFAPNLFLIDKFGSDDFDVFIANVRHYVLNEQCQVVVLDHFSLLAMALLFLLTSAALLTRQLKTSRRSRWSCNSRSSSYVISPETIIVSHLRKREASLILACYADPHPSRKSRIISGCSNAIRMIRRRTTSLIAGLKRTE